MRLCHLDANSCRTTACCVMYIQIYLCTHTQTHIYDILQLYVHVHMNRSFIPWRVGWMFIMSTRLMILINQCRFVISHHGPRFWDKVHRVVEVAYIRLRSVILIAFEPLKLSSIVVEELIYIHIDLHVHVKTPPLDDHQWSPFWMNKASMLMCCTHRL